MIEHRQANNSTKSAKRFSVRQLLRSAIAASVAVGFVSSASAQSDLVLPTLPGSSAALMLPVSQDSSFPVASYEHKTSHPATAKRVTNLLGLKKQAFLQTPPHATPTLAFPSCPSPLPTLPSTEFVSEQAASNSHSPQIFRSTSCKVGIPQPQHRNDAIVLASADELQSPVNVPPALPVQTALAIDESSEPESLEVSVSELESENLIDVEIPKSLVQDAQQRLPELVKRSPAMQLHIGGNVGSQSKITEQRATAPTNFSLSDSSDSDLKNGDSKASDLEKHTLSKSDSNSLNVRIEGEPAQVIPRSSAPAAGHLVQQKKSSFDPSSYSSGHKALTDKSAERPTTVGERLEVGLHESANIETTQPISGLSVEHPELCQVLKSGERSVSFVGLKAGQTRVALFTTNASGERKIEIREVVIAGAETRQADMKSLATEIGRSVHRMYPHSHIEVIAEAEGLTVQGYAASEAEAKKIIGLVRRTSLQPVVDRLATYK